jgi:uncharacterized protein YbjT (DUF2867 family)
MTRHSSIRQRNLGRHLVPLLVRSGATVRIAVRDRRRVRVPNKSNQAAVYVQADLLDDVAVGAGIAGTGAVVNLVGILTETSNQTYRAIHVEAARRVALAAQRHGLMRLIHISALGASPVSPAVSDQTKAAGELAVREVFPQATIVRPSLVFGEDDHFFSRFAAMIRSSPIVPLIGGGTTKFQPVFVDDMTAGLSELLKRSDTAWPDLRVWGASGLQLQGAPGTLDECFRQAAPSHSNPVHIGRDASTIARAVAQSTIDARSSQAAEN